MKNIISLSLTSLVTFLVNFLAFLFLFGCSWWTFENPEINHISPNKNQVDISIETSVVVQFSLEMNNVLTEKSFSLVDKNGTKVDGKFLWQGTTLTFRPFTSLIYGMHYSIKISKIAESKDGNNLLDYFESSFLTGQSSLTDFEVLSISPTNNSNITNVTNQITIDFNHFIYRTDFLANFSISPNVSFQFDYGTNSNQITITPLEDYIFQKTYTVNIVANLEDIYNRSLGETFSSSFKVGDDSIQPTLIEWGTKSQSNISQDTTLIGTNVDKNDWLYFKFSEPIHFEKVWGGFIFSDAVSFTLAKSENDENELILIPTAALISEKTYTITLNNSIVDLQENGLEEEKLSFSFKVNHSNSIRPRVISYQTGSSPNRAVQTDFDQLISLTYSTNNHYSNFVVSLDRPIKEISLNKNITFSKVNGIGVTTTPNYTVHLENQSNLIFFLENLSISNVYQLTLIGGDQTGLYDIHTNYLEENFNLLLEY